MTSERPEDGRRTNIAAERASDVQFVKYSTLGNTFIIVDETVTPLGSDGERAAFARWALEDHFGVGGSDNVLYLHRASGGMADASDPASEKRRGPARAEDSASADFSFRIFEHDGAETLSCGNGLLSTAALLRRMHPGREWRVLTEIPSGAPKVVSIGVGPSHHEAWVRFGRPRPTPADLFAKRGAPSESGMDRVENLAVPSAPGLEIAPECSKGFVFSAFLVFTGEPHLVAFPGCGLPSALERWLFPGSACDDALASVGPVLSPEMRSSSLLVDFIGRHVNEAYRWLFPQGVHLNFARVRDPEGVIEYRTYERAIDRETLACGSGAVATAFVARALGLVTGSQITLWPHRCRWHLGDASLSVSETKAGFLLTGRPRLIYTGVVARGELP